MKHPSSRELFRYWTALRGRRLAPDREEIDPAALRSVLGDSVLLSFDPAAGHPVRLAGTRVCALFGREMKGEPFLAIWDRDGRPLVESLIAAVADETTGVVAGALARTRDHGTAPIELLLLPLAQGISLRSRLIGVLAPLAVPYWIGSERVETLALGAFRHLIADPPRLSRPPARLRDRGAARFVVYEGGAAGKPRADAPRADRV